ncbi:hypothetical protein BV22DRAFT_1196612 [Leucogyrophana mollusca]|uniref:Uncharacterized protein n=1 Tax=Leucogyrophana mollusca TaxID=85980 RepID=A0ACB8BE37_9AGAM|nr:hypothetical protein BV22DRAFT_1196612 [Leucogyrophana mollusca]
MVSRAALSVQHQIPGLVGLTISLVMYGITLGQYSYYWRTFPNDKRHVKYFVALLLAMDTFHAYCSAATEWYVLVSCRRHGSIACPMGPSWQSIASLFLSVRISALEYRVTALTTVTKFLVPFITQSFYGQRIWIISGNNRIITSAIFFLAAAQIGCGFAVVMLGATHSSLMLSIPIMISSSLAAAVTDILISGSVYFYLRPGRFGIKRTETRIRHLTTVSINMGFLTCVMNVVMVVFNSKLELGFCVSGAAMIAVRSQINSVLAVLNARRRYPQRRHPHPFSTIQLPSIPSIQLSEMPPDPKQDLRVTDAIVSPSAVL